MFRGMFARRQEATPPSEDGVVSVSLKSLIALHHGAESLLLKSTRIRSLQSGGYVSPFKGRGMEFDEARPYMPGDDVRTLDWRVTARTGRAHTKLFREERERAVLLWVDLQRAMHFATQGAYKSVRAAQAAALLGWAAVHHGDRLGGLIFDEQDHYELRPRRGKPSLLHFCKRLATHSAWNTAPASVDAAKTQQALNQSLGRLRRVAQPGSLIFLLSDFVSFDEQTNAHLIQLARHNDLVLVSISDPLEETLPPAGQYRVSDGQRFLTLNTAAQDVREHYQQRFAWRQEMLQQLCRRHKMYLLPMSTAQTPLSALQKGLGKR